MTVAAIVVALPELLAMSVGVSLGWRLTRFLTGSNALRASVLQALFVRVTWRRLARVVGLVYRDPNPTWRAWIWRRADPHEDEPHIVVPRIRIEPDRYGVIVRTRPLPHVGRQEWEKAVDSLAASWRCARVGVSQDRRGRLVIRGVRRDPLTVPTVWRPSASVLGQPPGLSFWSIGVDEYAAPVLLQLAEVAGMTVAGLPGSGKSSLLSGLIARLAPTPAVQFVVLDGKGGQDYTSARPRLAVYVDDDLDAAHDLLVQLVELRRARARLVRSFWQDGPTVDIPLLVVVIDEAHSYFAEFKGSDQETRRLAALASENRRLVEDLVKKGRSVGVLTVLATQKATGDSLPTSIRDVCAVNVSFAQSTQAASVAALGDSIKEWPSADPITLQGRQYVGVCSMRLDGSPGFTRVRTPHVPDDAVGSICQQQAHLAVPLDDLMLRPLRVVPEDVAA